MTCDGQKPIFVHATSAYEGDLLGGTMPISAKDCGCEAYLRFFTNEHLRKLQEEYFSGFLRNNFETLRNLGVLVNISKRAEMTLVLVGRARSSNIVTALPLSGLIRRRCKSMRRVARVDQQRLHGDHRKSNKMTASSGRLLAQTSAAARLAQMPPASQPPSEANWKRNVQGAILLAL